MIPALYRMCIALAYHHEERHSERMSLVSNDFFSMLTQFNLAPIFYEFGNELSKQPDLKAVAAVSIG